MRLISRILLNSGNSEKIEVMSMNNYIRAYGTTFFIYPVSSRFIKLFQIRRQMNGCSVKFHEEMTIVFTSQHLSLLPYVYSRANHLKVNSLKLTNVVK